MKDRPLLLLPTDLSPVSRAAYAPAAEIAGRLGARIELLHVTSDVDPIVYVPPATPPPPPLTRDQVQELERDLQREREHLPSDIDVTAKVRIGGEPAQSIVDRAQEIDADLIVLATHGRSGLRRAVLGSVAERALRASHVPLLVVPLGELEQAET